MSTTTATIPLNQDAICMIKGFAFLTGGETIDSLMWAGTVQSKLMQYGYMLENEAFQQLRKCTPDDIQEYHDNVIGYLKNIMGGTEKFRPLYGDFPLSVMPEEYCSSLIGALNYYHVNGSFDNYETEKDALEFENVKYTLLKLGTNDDFSKVFTDIVSINQSLAPQDLNIVKWFVNNKRELKMPDNIPFKENLCMLAAMGVPGLPIKTPTDVLRIAVHMSGGDISLPKVPRPMKKVAKSVWKIKGSMEPNPERELFKFKRWTRAERKYLLGLLEKTHCDPREMVLKDQRWIKLAHGLHSGEYGKKFPHAVAAIHIVRNGKARSWYSKFYSELKKGLTLGLNVLMERPGEFLRRVDWLMRTYTNITEIAEIATKVKISAGSSSNKVMFELYNHLEKRKEDTNGRYVFVKGARKKTKLPDLKALPEAHVTLIQEMIKDALESKFRKLESLGKVWIDPELKKVPLPSNMRSTSLALKPQVRGQRMPLQNPNAKVVRAFYHWVDNIGVYDPDLSVTFVGMDKYDVLNFSSMRVGTSCHSGDIIARKGSNAEYIDIDVDDAKARGYKYCSVDIRNYRGGTLKEIAGVFGTMEREFPKSGKTWTPETVTGCHQLMSEASNTLVSIIDLDTMEYIFLGVDSSGSTNATHDIKGTLEVIKQFAELPKFSVYHLLEMHVNARGTLVDKVEDAEKVFPFSDFANDYVLTAQMMGV